MNNPTAKQMLTQSLIDKEYGGLYCEECSCGVEDLCNHCYELNSAMSEDCIAGHKVPCDCDLNECGIKCDYHIVSEKPEPECDDCQDTGKWWGKLSQYWHTCTCPAGQRLREGE